MKKIYNYLLVIFIVLLFLGLIWSIESKKNTIEELNLMIEEFKNIPQPEYLFENSSGYEHNYFGYAGVEFSSYTNKKDFYGCRLTDMDKSDMELYIYCKINENFCNVEFKDLKCLDDYLEGKDIWNMTIPLNKINCSRYYTIKGNVSERIY